MDEQKKRLIELLLKTDPIGDRDSDDEWLDGEIEDIADYLLENGVLVPLCKVGDKLWWVADNDIDVDYPAGVYAEENGVQNIAWDGKEFGVVVDGDFIPFGDQYAMLSEADAAKWLEENRSGNV